MQRAKQRVDAKVEHLYAFPRRALEPGHRLGPVTEPDVHDRDVLRPVHDRYLVFRVSQLRCQRVQNLQRLLAPPCSRIDVTEPGTEPDGIGAKPRLLGVREPAGLLERNPLDVCLLYTSDAADEL